MGANADVDPRTKANAIARWLVRVMACVEGVVDFEEVDWIRFRRTVRTTPMGCIVRTSGLFFAVSKFTCVKQSVHR